MNDNTGDFKNYPKSVGEVKSGKTNKASDIKPRELLIELLRDIDNGKINPGSMIVCMALPANEESDTRTLYACSSPSPYITISMLEIAKQQIINE